MPGRIVVALSDGALADQVADHLRGLGKDAIAFSDSMIALSALESARRARVLVASIEFRHGQPNGVALARLARTRQPDISVLFLGSRDMEQFTAGLGQLAVMPLGVEEIVGLVVALDDAAMSDAETHLAMARRRLHDAEQRVARQQSIVARMQAIHQASALQVAAALLTEMRNARDFAKARLERLEEAAEPANADPQPVSAATRAGPAPAARG